MLLQSFGIYTFLCVFVCMYINFSHASIIFGIDSIQGDIFNKDCSDPPVEAREEMADVVLTGTVRKKSRDPRNRNLYSANVEVKRVMKGKERLFEVKGLTSVRGRMVTVRGFGDPGICESDVRVFDTRILMLTFEDGVTLRLNSSVIRLSLRTLNRVEYAVRGKRHYNEVGHH
ncbi:uncharacterized protein LOC133205128 [Saccostrea echinata]|uniref:uncharacterized protein LOC133205128 n=1 Tax=Saccostrea echinata TaxID=191078 RepID=UPI002A822088|nr:uncharacterized protein LOC133205128 [Saccostrea echinata]